MFTKKTETFATPTETCEIYKFKLNILENNFFFKRNIRIKYIYYNYTIVQSTTIKFPKEQVESSPSTQIVLTV